MSTGQIDILFQSIFVAGLALVHAFAGKLHYLKEIPRSAWLSFAGGVSVAYVFIHIFPELEEAQQAVDRHGVIGYLEHHAYLVALIGLAFFYGMERLVKRHRGVSQKQPAPERKPGRGVFWLHIASFSLYNALIGYLLVDRENTFPGILFFFLAMGFHFLVNDHGLVQHHRDIYLKRGRWALSAAIVAGWGIGLMVKVSEAATGTLFAFLAGGIILNVLKEELPEERQSQFWPFAAGAVGYSALLLAG